MKFILRLLKCRRKNLKIVNKIKKTGFGERKKGSGKKATAATSKK